MAGGKWTVKRISVGFSQYEVEILEEFYKKYGREKTDVIRELVRNLKDS
ncbi:CopG family transcriptional regulator [Anabaena azotica]|uniref:CopG family transcriptional regulator n=1 Tax=Anabaena azotica FACHB-119 TaxID=947527 RepID=A0ABR8DB92_9NOST|nr:CopG family transcriptional regulator [Anabaena azotica]MBD2503728.1 CopG family transcriptional regulator [Anabaena azotica FACHB-119]